MPERSDDRDPLIGLQEQDAIPESPNSEPDLSYILYTRSPLFRISRISEYVFPEPRSDQLAKWGFQRSNAAALIMQKASVCASILS